MNTYLKKETADVRMKVKVSIVVQESKERPSDSKGEGQQVAWYGAKKVADRARMEVEDER